MSPDIKSVVSDGNETSTGSKCHEINIFFISEK